jgi:hypothetical protein
MVLGSAFLFCPAAKEVHQDPAHIKNTSSLLKIKAFKASHREYRLNTTHRFNIL